MDSWQVRGPGFEYRRTVRRGLNGALSVSVSIFVSADNKP